jgi:hypothetical protein
VKTKYKWNIIDYGDAYGLPNMAKDLTDMNRQGWEVYQIDPPSPCSFDFSVKYTDQGGLSDGDQVLVTSSTRVYFRK